MKSPRHTIKNKRVAAYIHDGGEGGGVDVGGDGGEDGLAHLPDVSALLGQERQQDVHHYLNPNGLGLLLFAGCGKVTKKYHLLVRYYGL